MICSSISTPVALSSILISSFLAILFLQSGLDKLNNWKSELGWMKEHFAKSPFKNMVPLLFAMLTALEIASGTLCAAGIISTLIHGYCCWIYWGNLLSCITIICLFFGQRMAKDYPGAASLTGYFVVTLIGVYLSC